MKNIRVLALLLAALPNLGYAISPGAATPCAEEASPSAAVEGTVNNLSCDPTTRALRVSGSFSPSGTGDENLKQVNGVTTSTGAGATGTGTQRVGVAQDATTVAGSAPGTAGTASANVVTVQGIAGATAVKTDGSATTQPVSGTVTVQQSTAANLKVDLSGTAVNSTAIKVDGSAVTQPVSGTVTVTDGAGALNVIVDSSALPSGASTAAKQPALGTAGSASADVITVQGAASMTKLLVTPDSVALPANQSVNVSQMNGVTTSMGAGNTDTGTQRVVVSTNQGAVNVSPDNVIDGVNVAASAASATVLTNTPIATIGYAVVDVNVSAFSATSLTPQASFDGGSTYATVRCKTIGSVTANDTISISATGVYECVAGDHFQLTQVGAGSTTAKLTLKRNSSVNGGLVWVSASTNATSMLQVGGYDGSTARRFTTDTSGNQKIDLLGNAAAIMDAATGAAVPANALMAGFSDGTNAQFAKVSADKAVMVTPVSPASGNILDGYQSFTSTTGATTLITITAGKTWVGQLVANASVDEAAAGAVQAKALVIFTTAGANITPAAGTYFACQASAGANAATGVVGSENSNFCTAPFTAICASGTCTIQVTTTQAGTNSRVDASAIGNMQ